MEPLQSPSRHPWTTGRLSTLDDFRNVYTQATAVIAENFCGAQIPVPTHLNIAHWRYYLQDYSDFQVVDFLEYGWPLGVSDNLPSPTGVSANYNHRSALSNGNAVDTEIAADLSINALVGPVDILDSNLPAICSPLQTVQRPDSSKIRLIVDLTYEKAGQHSVNNAIPPQSYLGHDTDLHYPSVDTLAQFVRQKGPGCLMFKADLKSAYKQLSLSPHAWKFTGISWRGKRYFYVREVFGLRTSALACQRTTNCVTFLMQQHGFDICNYLDDFAGADQPDRARLAFITLRLIFHKLNLIESVEKATPPATKLVFLGILLDSNDFTMTIPPSKMRSLLAELLRWRQRSTATKREIQSIIGKLQHVSSCIRGGRIFLNRMLTTLRGLTTTEPDVHVPLDADFKQDIT